MNPRQYRALHRHAHKHGVKLIDVRCANNAAGFELAKLAICDAAQQLMKSGDSWATTMELESGVTITVRRI